MSGRRAPLGPPVDDSPQEIGSEDGTESKPGPKQEPESKPGPKQEPEPKHEPKQEPEPKPKTARQERWHPAGEPGWRAPGDDSTVPERMEVERERATSTPQHSESEPIAPLHRYTPAVDADVGPIPRSSRAQFAEERDAIEFSLSHMVSGEPATWRFEALRARATALLAAAATPGDRADVRQILANIARFDELWHRRAALSGRRLAAASRPERPSPYPPPRNAPVRPNFPTPAASPAPAAVAPPPPTDRSRLPNQPASPQPASPQPVSPQPVSPQPASPQRVSPQRESGASGWASAPRPPQTPARSEDRGRYDSGADRTRIDTPRPTGNPQTSDPETDVVRIPDDNLPLPARSQTFDVTGVLKRVGSRRREAPRFALVDPTGDITSFITPSPGVNLQPFIGKQIGVYGTRGYMPEYRRAHITAARVTPLGQTTQTR